MNKKEIFERQAKHMRTQAKISKWGAILANCGGVAAVVSALAFVAEKDTDSAFASGMLGALLFLMGDMAWDSYKMSQKTAKKFQRKATKQQKTR
ncbi:MAG: hypothetical protein IJ273_00695 [Alphaproteobacteria bacterium]|nr:hypothetical protein [Alphaproteobacteria bacterium]MBQ8255599.1 hypothetical protein [Alphaproteobacteria bacterium]